MLKFLKLSFLPKSANVGLLILRVSLGFSMLLLHGRGKMLNFSVTAEKFPAVLYLPSNISLGFAVFAEVVCSVLLIVGLFTRFAALMLAATMGAAFFIVHQASLVPGPSSGELAMVYLVGYVTLCLTGAGKISVDRE